MILSQEALDGVQARPLRGAHHGNGRAQFGGEFDNVERAAAFGKNVRHIQEHERRQAQRDHGRCQYQMAREMGDIEYQQNRIWAGHSVHFSGQDVDGNAFIVGIRRQAVDAGKIDDLDGVIRACQQAHTLLDGYAGVIADLLTKPSETIEEGRLPGIRWADQGHRADFAARGRRGSFGDGDYRPGRSIAASLGEDRGHDKSPKGATTSCWTVSR